MNDLEVSISLLVLLYVCLFVFLGSLLIFFLNQIGNDTRDDRILLLKAALPPILDFLILCEILLIKSQLGRLSMCNSESCHYGNKNQNFFHSLLLLRKDIIFIEVIYNGYNENFRTFMKQFN